MRAVFGLVGLLLVMALVALLMKKQLSPTLIAPGTASLPAEVRLPPGAPASDVLHQGRAITEQIKQSLDTTLQSARPMPDDK